MQAKKFLITIDAEGDDQWDNSHACTTQNARYIPRFQELCEKYGYKPVWLTNYEMANDPFYVEYIRDRLDAGACEIGMHLHAWNNPPEYPLNKVTPYRDYLFEYPQQIMEEKIKTITYLLEDRFTRKILSHRSGRWSLDDVYLQLLVKYGYHIDCSVTPFVSWKNCLGATGKKGSDYSDAPKESYFIRDTLLEVPVTIRKIHLFVPERIDSLRGAARAIKHLLKGNEEWLRPDKSCSAHILKAVLDIVDQDSDYVMFMLHSAEMMPGGSPSFPDNESIERLYACIDSVFSYAHERGYTGATLEEYGIMKSERIKNA